MRGLLIFTILFSVCLAEEKSPIDDKTFESLITYSEEYYNDANISYSPIIQKHLLESKSKDWLLS